MKNETIISIFGKKIFTGTDFLENSYLNFMGSLITGISKEPEGSVSGKFPVITPSFIDAHSHIGLVRAGEPQGESEANDQADPFLPHADALDSVQMDDSGFKDSIESGVLYSCIVPGSGNIISGRSAVIRNYGRNTSEAFIARAGIKSAVGYNPMSVKNWKGTRPYTRMGALSMLRGKLHAVRQKLDGKKTEKDEELTFTAEEEIFRNLLVGEDFLRVHVHKIDDIAALLRIVDEYNLKITVEHTCDVHDGHIYEELARRKIAVVYGPMDCLAYKVELKHENWRNVRHLIESGVEFGLMTDHPVLMQNMLMFQLRWFIRCGLPLEKALQTITLSNARILGIDPFLGSLEANKWASFTCWNGDPLQLTSYPAAVYGEGRLLFSDQS